MVVMMVVTSFCSIVFSGKMSSSSVVSKGAGDFVSIFTFEEHIYIFLAGVGVSSSTNGDRVILENFLPSEMIAL